MDRTAIPALRSSAVHRPMSNGSKRPLVVFLVPSLIGALLFMTPVLYRDPGDPDAEAGVTIPVAILAKWLQSAIADSLVAIVTVLIAAVGVLSLLASLPATSKFFARHSLKALFRVSPLWLGVRLVGAIFAVLVFKGVGPEAIVSGDTGALVLNDLLPLLFCLFLFAGLLLPLLLDFGLLELAGTLLSKVMRPVFRLPGRSAIDCLTSWLGDGTVGVLLTSKQYEARFYTKREAAVIGTTFSAVSITFSLVVIAQVKLEHLFVPYYFAVCLAGIVAAIVVPRLPPLSWKKDELIDGSVPDAGTEAAPGGSSLFRHGLDLALERARKVGSVWSVAKGGIHNVADMWFGVLPAVMAIGTTGLMVATYTPVLDWLGLPFVPLLNLLAIPEASEASKTMVVGFADMFTPSILASGSIESELTRFVIAALSVTQLIYLSEVGAVLLNSRIPVNLVELFVVFLLRTLVTLPVIALVGHMAV